MKTFSTRTNDFFDKTVTMRDIKVTDTENSEDIITFAALCMVKRQTYCLFYPFKLSLIKSFTLSGGFIYLLLSLVSLR